MAKRPLYRAVKLILKHKKSPAVAFWKVEDSIPQNYSWATLTAVRAVGHGSKRPSLHLITSFLFSL
jgi:hypothetical protein